MKNEWFSAKELMGNPELPSSTQGINLMARREGWLSRRRKGVQGKALEYHIDSFSSHAKKGLALQEYSASSSVERQVPLCIWMEYFHHMTESERVLVMSFLMRKGVSRLLCWINTQKR